MVDHSPHPVMQFEHPGRHAAKQNPHAFAPQPLPRSQSRGPVPPRNGMVSQASSGYMPSESEDFVRNVQEKEKERINLVSQKMMPSETTI